MLDGGSEAEGSGKDRRGERGEDKQRAVISVLYGSGAVAARQSGTVVSVPLARYVNPEAHPSEEKQGTLLSIVPLTTTI